MKLISIAAVLLSLVIPSLALSSVEQAYVDGVNDGVKLGKVMSDTDAYNIAIQQFNDKINQTFGANASLMWLPQLATNDTAPIDTLTSVKPVHKMDATPREVTVMQY
jgi:hypothetical protein